MRSTLQIMTPAANVALLTIEEMRAAAGVSGNSQDAVLQIRGAAVTQAIMTECNIAVGAGAPPTLMQETIKETFYETRRVRDLVLARRHNVVIESAAIAGADIDVEALVVDPEAGIVGRLAGYWSGSKIEIVYTAGFEEVPADLKAAALDAFRSASLSSTRDPFVKGETREIPGLETVRKDYWVGNMPGNSTADAVPAVVTGQLSRYRNSSLE